MAQDAQARFDAAYADVEYTYERLQQAEDRGDRVEISHAEKAYRRALARYETATRDLQRATIAQRGG